MFEEKIDQLREKLYSLITEKADYSEILKASQELDVCITEFTYTKLSGTSGRSNVKKSEE